MSAAVAERAELHSEKLQLEGNARYVSSYYYIRVLVLFYVSSYYYICVLIRSFEGNPIYASSYYYIRVLVLFYVSFYYYICVRILLYYIALTKPTGNAS